MHVKAFIVNVNKRLNPFFLEQHINIVNRVTLQSVWFIFTLTKLPAGKSLYNPVSISSNRHVCDIINFMINVSLSYLLAM